MCCFKTVSSMVEEVENYMFLAFTFSWNTEFIYMKILKSNPFISICGTNIEEYYDIRRSISARNVLSISAVNGALFVENGYGRTLKQLFKT